MTNEQIMWGVNTLLLGVVAALIKGWMNSVKEAFKENKETFEKISKRLDNMDREKVEVKWCDRLHDGDRRRHSSLEQGTAT